MAMPADLLPNQSIPVGGYIESPNGRFILTFQNDGNLVFYDRSTNPWTAKWEAHANGLGADLCRLEPSGILVLYKPGAEVVWSTEDPTPPDVWLRIEDAGNAVIYFNDGGRIDSIWDSASDQDGGRWHCVRVFNDSSGKLVIQDSVRTRSAYRAQKHGEDFLGPTYVSPAPFSVQVLRGKCPGT